MVQGSWVANPNTVALHATPSVLGTTTHLLVLEQAVCAGHSIFFQSTPRTPTTHATHSVPMGGAAACRLPVAASAVASSGGGCGPSEREDRSDLQSDRSSAQRRWGRAGRTNNIPPLLAPLRPWLSLLPTGTVRLSCPCEKAETAIIRAQSRTEKRKLPTEKTQCVSVMAT